MSCTFYEGGRDSCRAGRRSRDCRDLTITETEGAYTHTRVRVPARIRVRYSGLPETRTRVTRTGVAFTFTFTNTSPGLLASSSPSLFSTIRINLEVEAPEERFAIVHYTDSNLPLL